MATQQERIINDGLKAFAALKKSAVISFDLWIKVGQGLEAGKALICNRLKINALDTTIGKRAYSAWLKETGYDAVSQPERHYLAKIIEDLADIQEWYARFDDAKKRRMNHPSSVWQNWSEHCRRRDAPPPSPTFLSKNGDNTPELNDEIDSLAELVSEIARSHGETTTNIIRLIREAIAGLPERERPAA